jgi:hypothetical protein
MLRCKEKVPEDYQKKSRILPGPVEIIFGL